MNVMKMTIKQNKMAATVETVNNAAAVTVFNITAIMTFEEGSLCWK